MSTKTALIIGSDGSEEIELIVTSDVLRRGGVNVTIVGLEDKPVIACARQAKLQVDKPFKDVIGETFDAVIMPGGQFGSNNLAADSRVGEVLRHHEGSGKIVAAICAAPIALASHKIAAGAQLTAYPAVRDKLMEAGYTFSEDKVCIYKNVVTSQGPGTAFDFALKLLELLVDAQKSAEVQKALLL